MKSKLYIVTQNNNTKKIKFYQIKEAAEFESAESFMEEVCNLAESEPCKLRLVPSQGSFFKAGKDVIFPTYVLMSNTKIQMKNTSEKFKSVLVDSKIENDFVESVKNFSDHSPQGFCYRMQFAFQDEKFTAKHMRELYEFYCKTQTDAGNFHKMLKVMGAKEDGYIFTPRKTKALRLPKK